MTQTGTAPLHRATPREWASLGVLTLAVVLLAIDGTVLALAVPSLTADLGPSATQLLWIGDVYSFALAGLLVTMGNVADRIGRKRLLLIGSVAFLVGSVITDWSNSWKSLVLLAASYPVYRAIVARHRAGPVIPKERKRLRDLFSVGWWLVTGYGKQIPRYARDDRERSG